MKHKSGFVAIMGCPNAGKSTLLNNFIGEKIAIVSPKVQTTRNAIRGILDDENFQIIFVDTPGTLTAKNKLNEYMETQITSTINDVEVIIYLFDCEKGIGQKDEKNLDKLLKIEGVKKIAIFNKIDKTTNINVSKMMENMEKRNIFDDYFAISLKHKSCNVKVIISAILNFLDEGPKYYLDKEKTDAPDFFHVNEIIREKILYLTNEEVPHSIAVKTTKMNYENGIYNINSTIYVERDSQKGIIIGSQAKMLKSIGTKARHELEIIFGVKVFLSLTVKVAKNWRDLKQNLKDFGYEE